MCIRYFVLLKHWISRVNLPNPRSGCFILYPIYPISSNVVVMDDKGYDISQAP